MKKKMYAAIGYLRRNRVATRLLSFVLSAVLVFYVAPTTVYAKIAEAINSNVGEYGSDADMVTRENSDRKSVV